MVFRSLAVLLAVAAVVIGASVVHADQYDEKINALSAQNARKAGIVNGLTTQADNYRDTIARKQSQIGALEAQIADNEAKKASLESQIAAHKREIMVKKASLAEDVKTMYVDGQMSTIEELASSKSLSDYVDKEEYRTSVQNQLNDKIKEIADLQAELESQKEKVDEVITTTKAQNNQLSQEKAEQSKLLAYNENQQSAYNSQIAANNSRISELRAEQLAANARFISGGSYSAGSGPTCGGGYPGVWCNAPQDSIIDSWGMYNRECVSYTAFRVAASGRHMPYWGGYGNANQWPGNARAAHIPMSYGGGARRGDVAISTRGAFGHAMYVEGVSGGNVYVSQYNAALDGRYSTATVSQAGLYFIHF